MIERDPPFFWDVSCDGCAHGEERISTDDADSFRDVVDEIKERGWRVSLISGEWRHFCPDCAEKDSR